ncbi:hypothetical protein FOA52_005515 [Chlamydomonas sp. UWO 241]|nr:hypothetical protein FOA52_005515 [Chlamydomonas sp. UWO 241]
MAHGSDGGSHAVHGSQAATFTSTSGGAQLALLEQGPVTPDGNAEPPGSSALTSEVERFSALRIMLRFMLVECCEAAAGKTGEFCFAVRDPYYPPAAAPANDGAAAEIAAAAAAKAAAEAAEDYAELPPTIKALLSSKVVEAKGKTQGWRYLTFERCVCLEVDQVQPGADAAAVGARSSSGGPEPAGARSSSSRPEPTGARGSSGGPEPAGARGSSSRPEPTSTRGSSGRPEPTGARGSSGGPEPTGARGSSGGPEPTGARGSSGGPEPTGARSSSSGGPEPAAARSSSSRPEPTGARGSSGGPEPTGARGSSGGPEPTGARSSSSGGPEPAAARSSSSRPEPTGARGSIGGPEPAGARGSSGGPEPTGARGSSGDPEPTGAHGSSGGPEPAGARSSSSGPEPTGRLPGRLPAGLLDCIRRVVGAVIFEELLLQQDHYEAAWLHRAATCSDIRFVRWGCGEAVPGQPSPLDDAIVRRLLIARTLHGWLPYHEFARCGRIDVTAVLLRAMLRVFGPEVVQGLVFKLHNKHFVNNGGNDTLQAARMLAFGPGFVLAEGPTYGDNRAKEKLLARLRMQ